MIDHRTGLATLAVLFPVYWFLMATERAWLGMEVLVCGLALYGLLAIMDSVADWLLGRIFSSP